ncbi:MAG: beta strand repeat-containing protein, partial [Planctomycetota bacterium]
MKTSINAGLMPQATEALEDRVLLTLIAYDEGVSGDLSNSISDPVFVIDTAGANTWTGTLETPGDGFDGFQIDLASGFEITDVRVQYTDGSNDDSGVGFNGGSLGSHSWSNTSIDVSAGSFNGSNPTLPIQNISGSDTTVSNFSIFGGFVFPAAPWTLTVTAAAIPVPPSVDLSVDLSTGTEAAGTVVTVTATADAAVSGAQTVDLGVSGTGVTSDDYTLSNTTITIPDGMTTGSVTFTVDDDRRLEADETATLTISNPSAGIQLGTTTTQDVDITDNETATVSISSGTDSVTEGGGSVNVSATLMITASGTGTVGSDVTITADLPGSGDYSTTEATFGTGDFTSDSQDIAVTADNDQDLEATTESIPGQNVSVTDDGGASVSVAGGSGSRQIDVTDDESATLAIEATSSADEQSGDQSVGTVTLTITGSGSGGFRLGDGITVSADVTDAMTGSATSGTDYAAVGTQTITFDSNAATASTDSATLTAQDDIEFEGNETINLALGNLVTGGTDISLGNAANVLTLSDDDTATTSSFAAPDDGMADSYRLVLNGANVELRTVPGDALVSSRAIADLTGGVVINGADGEDDSLEVDFSGGDTVPAGGITFNGGTGGNDTLTITGGAQGDVTYGYTNANDGSVGMSNFGTINYTGLEPVVNTGTADNVVFNLPGTADATITLADLVAGTSLRLDSTVPTFEQTDFSRPNAGGSITINMGANDQTITVGTLTLDTNTSLTIAGDGGTDAVAFSGTTITGNLDLEAESITQTGVINVTGTTTLDAGAGTITLTQTNDFTGDVTVTNAGTMASFADANSIQFAGINAGALAVSVGTGNITDTSGATISVTNQATFTSALGGITLGDNGGDTTNFGTLLFNAPLSAVSITEDSSTDLVGANLAGSLDLNSSDAIDDTGAASTGVTNLADIAGTSITLGQAFTAGTLTFNSAGAVDITENDATNLSGTSTADSLDLNSGGAITDDGSADVTVDNNADFADTGGAGITLEDTYAFGTLTFTSTGAVDITEADDTDLSGTSAASSLVLDSAGAIADDGSADLTVTNNSDLTGTSITLDDTYDFGSLTTDTTGTNGAQDITETDGIAGLDLDAGAGTISLVSGGALTDTDGTNDVTASDVILEGDGGVGAGANAIQTTISQLDVSNATGGGIFVTNTGGLTLTDLGGTNTNAVNGVGGGGEIAASSPLTISADASTTGGMTYTATDSAGAGDDLTVDNGATVDDDTALTLNAGDDLDIQVGTTVEVTGAGATLDLVIDFGDADGTGQTANLFGTIGTVDTTIDVTGGDDGDTFNIDDNGGAIDNGGTVDNIQDNLLITSGSGADTLNLDDSGDTSADTSIAVTETAAGAGAVTGLTTASLSFTALGTGSTANISLPSDTTGDIITITPNDNIEYNVDGNTPNPTASPASQPNGDRLVYDGTGTKTIDDTAGGTIASAGSEADVNFDAIEEVRSSMAGALTDVIDVSSLTGGADANANAITVRLDAGTGTFLEILFDGDTASAGDDILISTQLFASVGEITINGTSDDDLFVVDLTNGDPIPATGITVNGGTQTTSDALLIEGGAQGTVTYNYDNANDGDVMISNFGTINYTGLEPITNTGTATDVIFNLPDGTANNPTLQNNTTVGGTGTGYNELTGTNFEDTFFTNPSNSLTVNLGDMGDDLDVNTLDSSYAASMIINGTAGATTDRADLTNVNIDTNDNGRGLLVTEVETLNITGGTITDNTAAGDGGGVLINNSTSGTDTTAVLDGVTISNNVATGNGGGLAHDGATVTIQNSSMITGNQATGGDGGGIESPSGMLTVDGSTISGNTTADDGGGINDDGGTVIIQNSSVITMNTATSGDGGGIDSEGPLTIDGSTISNNTAGNEGGGVWNDGGLTLANTVLITGNDAAVNGGGLYLGDTTTTTGATITVSNNTASGNAATEGGGAIYNDGQTLNLDGDDTISGNQADGTSGSGGGIFNASSGTLNLTGTTIDMNSANRAGGGIEATGGSTVNLTNIILTNNDVDGGAGAANPGNGGGLHATGNVTIDIDGGTITGNAAAEEGGGLWNGSGTMTIRDDSGSVLIDSNTASGAAADQGGGGIFNSAGGTVEIEDNTGNSVTISNNLADGAAGSGGGIFNDVGSTLTVTGAVIDMNSANRAGGGIEDNSGAGGGVTLTNVTVSNNDVDGGAGAANPGNGGGLHVTGAGDVDIDGGSFTGNAAAEEGGGIWNGTGTLTIDDTSGNVLIDNNTASGAGTDQGGGGIFNAAGGTVDIQDNSGNSVTISNNLADGAAGSGGGILNDAGGTLTIDGAIIDMNSANRAGGGIEDNSGAGLGVTLTDVTLSNNDVDGGAGAANPGNGGGLHVSNGGDVNITGGSVNNNDAAEEGGGLWNDSGTLTLSNVTIDTNTASGAGTDQGGGGIFNNGGTLDITDGAITNNVADGTQGSGGGILDVNGTSVTINGTNISSNNAERAGGGIELNGTSSTVTLTSITLNSNNAIGTGAAPGNGGGLHITGSTDVDITGSTVDGNTAAEEGGGLWNGTGTMTIDSTTVSGNTASGATADQGGGGVFNAGGTVDIVNSSLITGNTADGAAGTGGGILNDATGTVTVTDSTVTMNDATTGDGGGISNTAGSDLTVTNSTVSSNTAGGNGGGILNDGTATVESASMVTGNTAGVDGGGIYNSATGTLDVDGSTVSGNDATTGDGGGIWNTGDLTLQNTAVVSGNTAGSDGGGLYLDNGTVALSITDTSIAGNTADGAGATSGGGGIFNDGLTFTLDNTVSITANTASAGNGGGLFNSNGGDVTLDGTTVTGNDATLLNGGGIYNPNGSTLTIDSSSNTTNIAMNTAGADGAGIWNGGDLTISGGTTTIDSNDAGSDGGGLFLDSTSTHAISDVTISDNTASEATNPGGGGGIFNNDNDLTLDGTVSITGNHADGAAGSGGGIFHTGTGTLDLTDTLIDSNSANRAGGGIEATDGTTVNLTTVTLTNNDVDGGAGAPNPGNGGGLHATMNVTIDIDGGTITGNDAAAEGGGLWNGTGTMTIRDDSGNVLIDGNTASGAGSDQGGGGIFNAGGIVEIQDNTANSVTISNNDADGTQGSGGGILNDQGTLTITGAIIDNNNAERAGGGIETNIGTVTLHDITITNNDALGSGAAAGNGGGLHITGAGMVTIHTDDTSNAGTDSTISDNTAAEEGGGLWNSSTGTLTLNVNGGLDAGDITIDNNTAAGDGANQGGGGLFNDGGTVIITGTDNDDTVLITNNDATGATNGSGGGILSVGGTVDGDGAGGSIGNILIDSNTAVLGGGGALIAGGTFDLENSLISNNSVSAGDGGGVQVTGGTVDIDATTIVGNSASANGGGLWNSDGTVTLTNTTITTNSAGNDGGGIYGSGTGLVDTDSVTITLNTAGGAGAGIFSSVAGSVSIENTIVAQNPGGGTEDNLGGGANAIDSEDYNLIGDADDGTLADPHPESIFNGDALLVPLNVLNFNPNEVNSVTIPDHLPAAGSPAIGNGDTDLIVDQRDVDRPQASQDDIGAIEVALNGFVIDAAGQANDGNPDEFIIIQDDQNTANLDDDEVVIFVNSSEVFRDSAVTTGQIIIRGSSDDDTLIVDNSEGLVQSAIVFDGDGTGTPNPSGVHNPGGFDTLVLRGSTPTTTTYNPGESSDQGAIFQENNAIEQRVEFFGLEPVQVVGTGAGDTLVVGNATLGMGFPQALNDANMVTYREGANSQSEFHMVFGAAATGVAGGAVTGLVEVDGFESLEFSNFGTLDINGGSGSDEIVLNHRDIPSDLAAINVEGGDPTAGSDTVIITANGTGDTIDVTGVTADGATVDVELDSAGTPVTQPTVVVTGAEHLVLDGDGGNDDLTVTGGADDEQFTISQTGGDAGGLSIINQTTTTSLIDIAFEGLGTDGSLTIDGATGTDEAVYEGTSNNDVLTVTNVMVADETVQSAQFIDVALDTENLDLNLGNGDDDVTIDANTRFTTIDIQGGSAGVANSVTLTELAEESHDIAVDLAAGTVTSSTAGTISVTGVGTLNIITSQNDAMAQDDTVAINGLGTASDISELNLNGNGATAVTIDGTAGDDTLVFDPDSASAGSVSNSAGPSDLSVDYTDVTSTLNVTGGSAGFDVLEVLGTGDNDTITTTDLTITRDGTVTFDASIEQTNILAGAGNDTITTGALATLKVLDGGDGDDTIDASAAVDATILGGAGDDNLIGSPIADLIDGGQGSDSITAGAGDDTIFGGDGDDSVTGGTGSDSFFGGDGSDDFTWNVGDGSDVFEGDAGDDLLIFNGDAAANTIDVSSFGALAQVQMGGATVQSGDVEEIFIDAGADADTVNVADLAITDVNFVNIDLTAGDAGDAVNVTATTGGDDDVAVSEVGGLASVSGLAALVNISNAEADDTISVDGGNGADTLRVTNIAGTVGVTGTVITGATTADLNFAGLEVLNVTEGGVALTQLDVSGATDYAYTPGTSSDEGTVEHSNLAINFEGVGAGETVTVDGAGTLTVNGTGGNDAVSVAASNDVTVSGQATVTPTNITTLTLAGQAGVDTYTVDGGNSYTTINVEGSGSDVLDIDAAAAAVTVDLGAATVAGYGAALNYGGLAAIDADANGESLTVNGTAGDDSTTVTPLTAGSGTVANGSNPVVSYSGVAGDAITVDGVGGEDTVTVVGNETDETFTVSDSAVVVGGQTVNFTAEALIVDGQQGSDTFNVTAGAIAISIDGGDPVGGIGDSLNISAGSDAVTANAGPESDEGSFVVGANQAVSYDHIESTSVDGDGTNALTVNGDGADNDITLTQTGADDFTVSVDGQTLSYTDFASTTLNGGDGDDDITVSYLTGTAFTTTVAVNGDSPTGNTGDSLHVEATTDADTITVTGTTITLTGSGAITYGTLESLSIDALGGADTVNVSGST